MLEVARAYFRCGLCREVFGYSLGKCPEHPGAATYAKDHRLQAGRKRLHGFGMSVVVRVPATTLRRGSPEEAGMSPSRVRHIVELAGEWINEGLAPAMVLLVARRGIIVLHEAFGRLTMGTDSRPTPLDAIFPLASLTKVLTATALMTLVDEGRVGLNRPVSSYIPEFQGEGKAAVLVRHLLTHTSGLKEEEIEKHAEEMKGKVDAATIDAVHRLVLEHMALRYSVPLWKPPGVEMSYADFNFDLAGEIVRRVSGLSIDRYAEARIFRPLGMHDTHYCRVDVPKDRRLWRPPDPGTDSQVWMEALEKERVPMGSGRAWSSSGDLAIFGQMFLNGGAYGSERILSPASVAAMTTNQTPNIPATFLQEVFPDASWGLGWSIHGSKSGLCGALYSPQSFEHWGSGGVYSWVDPPRELVGVYFSPSRPPYTPDAKEQDWRNDLITDAVTAAVEDG